MAFDGVCVHGCLLLLGVWFSVSGVVILWNTTAACYSVSVSFRGKFPFEGIENEHTPLLPGFWQQGFSFGV